MGANSSSATTLSTEEALTNFGDVPVEKEYVSARSFSLPTEEALPPLEENELNSLLALASNCVLDSNVTRRKTAMHQLLELLLTHSPGGLLERKEVLDMLCLALALNVVSTDEETQCGALKGIRYLCEATAFISPLLDKGVANSICTLLKRESTTDEALALCLRCTRFICLQRPDSCESMLEPFYNIIDQIISTAQRLGSKFDRECLLILSTFPLERLAESDRVWELCADRVLKKSLMKLDPRLINLVAKLAMKRGSNSLKALLGDDGQPVEIMKSCPSSDTRRALLAANKVVPPKSELASREVSLVILEMTNEDDTTEEGLNAMIYMSLLSERVAKQFVDLDAFRLLHTVLLRRFKDLSSLIAQACICVLIVGCLLDNLLPPRECGQILCELQTNLFWTTLGKLLLSSDARDEDLKPLFDVKDVSMDNDESRVQQLTLIYLWYRRLSTLGWIESGLFDGSEPLSQVMDREESEDQLEKQFVWSWKTPIVKWFISLANQQKIPMITRIAAKCLLLVARVEGPDRVDGLILDLSWECSPRDLFPINVARPDLFHVSIHTPPTVVRQPKDLRAGVIVHADERIDYTLNSPSETMLSSWTVTVWLKQVQPALTSEENAHPRVVLGSMGSDDVVLGFDEDLQLGFKVGGKEWKTFGSWNQLASGWHHVVFTCGDIKHISGLDLVMGRSHLISCFVDGNRLGSPIGCAADQYPNVSKGVVIGSRRSGADCLGPGFSLSEVRLFETCLSERTVSASVARSSFNRRPNWNLSASSGNSRMTAAHIWARNRLLEMSETKSLLKTLTASSYPEIKLAGYDLVYLLSTVSGGKDQLAKEGIDVHYV